MRDTFDVVFDASYCGGDPAIFTPSRSLDQSVHSVTVSGETASLFSPPPSPGSLVLTSRWVGAGALNQVLCDGVQSAVLKCTHGH